MKRLAAMVRAKVRAQARKVVIGGIAAVSVVVPIAFEATPAGAAFVGPRITPIPTTNSCYYRYWFDQGTYNPSPGLGFQMKSTVSQPSGCSYNEQFKVLCGVYGTPTTNYWHVGYHYTGGVATGGSVPDGIPAIAFANNDACPIWGNDIILEIIIVHRVAGTGVMWGWSENNQQWIYNCIGVQPRCYFEPDQVTYWA